MPPSFNALKQGAKRTCKLKLPNSACKLIDVAPVVANQTHHEMCGRQSDPGEQAERSLCEGPVEHGKQRRLGSHQSKRTSAFSNGATPLPPNRTDRGRGRSGVPGSVPRLTGTATNVNILMEEEE